MNNYKEFFEEYEDWNIFMIYDNVKRKQLAFGVEDLCQAFKARLMDEVVADVGGKKIKRGVVINSRPTGVLKDRD